MAIIVPTITLWQCNWYSERFCFSLVDNSDTHRKREFQPRAGQISVKAKVFSSLLLSLKSGDLSVQTTECKLQAGKCTLKIPLWFRKTLPWQNLVEIAPKSRISQKAGWESREVGLVLWVCPSWFSTGKVIRISNGQNYELGTIRVQWNLSFKTTLKT